MMITIGLSRQLTFIFKRHCHRTGEHCQQWA